jgi:hypothetical protein
MHQRPALVVGQLGEGNTELGGGHSKAALAPAVLQHSTVDTRVYILVGSVHNTTHGALYGLSCAARRRPGTAANLSDARM